MSRQIPVVTGSTAQPTTGSRVLQAPKPTDVALGAYQVGDLFYNGFTLTADLLGIVTDIQIERSIEEATTLTITARDRRRLLLQSGALDERANLDIGDHRFRLVHVNKTGDDFTLTFEDRDVARLRGVTTPRKVSRNKVTRAEFAKMLVDETPGIDFFCPDLHVKQPIDPAATDVGTAPADPTPAQLAKGAKSKGLGFPPGVKLTVKKQPANAQQLDILSRLLNVAAQVNANPLATLAMICSTIGESTVSYEVNSLGYGGPLQAAAKNIGPRDVEQQAHYFLLGGKGFNQGGAIALSKTVKDPGEIATRVETSGAPGSFYGQHAPEARAIIAAFTGQPYDASQGNSPAYATPTVTTIAKAYEFTRGLPNAAPGDKPENTWDCLARLAGEVQRRRFLIDRVVTFAFEKDLLKLAPVMTISETDAGIDWIDFDRDEGKHVESATVTCRVEAWAAPPGSVVVVEDLGDASGRWLVSRISGSLFLPGRSIELTRGLKALREPAHETTTKVTDANPTDVTPSSSDSTTPSGPVTFDGTPKHIIDAYALPIARANGVAITVDSVTAANARHGHTQGGNRSDHEGPPAFAWAADIGIGPDIRGGGNAAGAARGDKIAKDLAAAFGIHWSGSGLASAIHNGYRIQLIWRFDSPQAGNHYTHVHVGVKKGEATPFGGYRP
jgi:hypothetical protein